VSSIPRSGRRAKSPKAALLSLSPILVRTGLSGSHDSIQHLQRETCVGRVVEVKMDRASFRKHSSLCNWGAPDSASARRPKRVRPRSRYRAERLPESSRQTIPSRGCASLGAVPGNTENTGDATDAFRAALNCGYSPHIAAGNYGISGNAHDCAPNQVLTVWETRQSVQYAAVPLLNILHQDRAP